jgi:predicted kinase
VITHGFGSGKTFATQQVVEATGAIRLRSDVERKRLSGLSPLERSTDRSDLNLYTPDMTQRTYAHLAQQAARVIEAGFTVVIDATFLKRAQRDAFRHLAAQLNVPCTILEFRAHEETLRRRVARRSAQADDASEANLAVLHGQLATLEPLTAEEQAAALTIDTEAPQAPQRLLAAVRYSGGAITSSSGGHGVTLLLLGHGANVVHAKRHTLLWSLNLLILALCLPAYTRQTSSIQAHRDVVRAPILPRTDLQ